METMISSFLLTDPPSSLPLPYLHSVSLFKYLKTITLEKLIGKSIVMSFILNPAQKTKFICLFASLSISFLIYAKFSLFAKIFLFVCFDMEKRFY